MLVVGSWLGRKGGRQSARRAVKHPNRRVHLAAHAVQAKVYFGHSGSWRSRRTTREDLLCHNKWENPIEYHFLRLFVVLQSRVSSR